MHYNQLKRAGVRRFACSIAEPCYQETASHLLMKFSKGLNFYKCLKWKEASETCLCNPKHFGCRAGYIDWLATPVNR